MKRCSAASLVTLALALTVQTFFRLHFPLTPLTPEGTWVVVGMCAVVVLSATRLWTHLRYRTRPTRYAHHPIAAGRATAPLPNTPSAAERDAAGELPCS
jgi:hypothetical protein